MQRTLLTSALVLLGLLVIGRAQGPQLPPLVSTTPKAAIGGAKAVRSCESLAGMALPNTTIASATIDAANANICRVTAITTHPPSGDKVTIWMAIPIANWNGRFLGNGGGAFVGGEATDVDRGVALGFASGATDTGHEGGSGGGEFALDANGRLNWEAIRDFAHVGIHDMTVTGKALTQAMYGVAPKYLVLERLLHRRTPGADGSAALSTGLRWHRGRSARHQHGQHGDAVAVGRGTDAGCLEPDPVVQARRGHRRGRRCV